VLRLEEKSIRAPKLFHGRPVKSIMTTRGFSGSCRRAVTATRDHSLIVERKSLPRELTITAEKLGWNHHGKYGTGT